MGRPLKALKQPLQQHNQAGKTETELLLAFMRDVQLFLDVKDTEQALIAVLAAMEERIYAPQELIIREGDPGSEMFILFSGRASVFRRTPAGEEYLVAVLDAEKHAFFGEGGLIEAETRSATIRSDTECHCLVLNRTRFDTFSQANSEWALLIYRRIACAVLTRLRKTNNDLMLLYNALVSEIRGH